MKRKEFIKISGMGCLGMLSGISLMSGCAGVKYIQAPIEGSSLTLPVSSFTDGEKNLTFLVVGNDELSYPIFLHRIENQYRASLMRCTHQGTELQAFGDRLQCPAHGSEFTSDGAVQNGPADQPLRTFPVNVVDNQIKIDLR